MVINRKIKRTIIESKAQYIGALALIIISCLLYTMFNQLTDNMSNISASFEKNNVQEDAGFIADRKLGDIQSLESKFNMLIEESVTFDYPVSKDKTLRVFTENRKVNIPAIVEGKGLSGNDILIDPAYAKANSIDIGDSINIYGKAFKVSGYMSLPNYIYPLKSESDLLNDPNSFGIAVVRADELKEMQNGSTSYSIKYLGDKSDTENKIAEFKDYLKSNSIVVLKWTNIGENPRVMYVKAKIDGISQVSSTLPVGILLLTCILTGVVMWRMLKREAAIIGTLYALGYKKREIIRHYIRYPLSIALIGGVVGTILGTFTLRPMLDFMVMYFNLPLDLVSFSTKYIVISILLPVIFLSVCGYFVVNRALKYSPVDLIKGGKETGKVGFFERRLKLERLKFTTKYKVREQLRSIPRSVFLLFGVIIATMLLLFGFASKCTVDFLMNDTYQDTYKYRYEYVFNSLQQEEVKQGEGFSLSPFTLKSDSKKSFVVYGINPDSRYILLKNKAGDKLDFDKVIITRPLADRLKLKAGDTVTAVNKLDSRVYDITVDSIAETYVGEYIYMPIFKFNGMLKVPPESYTGLWSAEKLDIPQNKLLSMSTVDDLKKAFDEMLQPLQYAIGIMAFLSFIIGLIVIYVVTSLIVEENRINISLMKVLGYRKKEVYSLILNSSSLMIIMGYILGVPLLLASLKAMFKSVTESMNITFPVTIDYIYVVAGFAVIYFAYELSKTLSRRKVGRISMTEVLKSGLE